MTKACVISTTAAASPILKQHLPPNVTVEGELARIDHDAVELRLEGDGLPEWCVVAHNGNYMRAVAELLEDGTLRLIPGTGLPVQQIPEKFLREATS
jgi:hypothetical protein